MGINFKITRHKHDWWNDNVKIRMLIHWNILKKRPRSGRWRKPNHADRADGLCPRSPAIENRTGILSSQRAIGSVHWNRVCAFYLNVQTRELVDLAQSQASVTVPYWTSGKADGEELGDKAKNSYHVTCGSSFADGADVTLPSRMLPVYHQGEKVVGELLLKLNNNQRTQDVELMLV